MDDQTTYRTLREKMERLLKYVNTATGTTYGACQVDGSPCRVTPRGQCPAGGTWTEGVECQNFLPPIEPDERARASQELVGRMQDLLVRVHAGSANAQVRSYEFEAGGQTYCLELTPDEFEVLQGVATPGETAVAAP
jgi:hypothetical protein